MSFKTGYAYFTDWRLGGIVRVRKSDGGEMTIIRRGISNIMHVKAYDAHSQIGELFSCTDRLRNKIPVNQVSTFNFRNGFTES